MGNCCGQNRNRQPQPQCCQPLPFAPPPMPIAPPLPPQPQFIAVILIQYYYFLNNY